MVYFLFRIISCSGDQVRDGLEGERPQGRLRQWSTGSSSGCGRVWVGWLQTVRDERGGGSGNFSLDCYNWQRKVLPSSPQQESLLATSSQLSTLRWNTNLIGQIPGLRLGQVYWCVGSMNIKKNDTEECDFLFLLLTPKYTGLCFSSQLLTRRKKHPPNKGGLRERERPS